MLLSLEQAKTQIKNHVATLQQLDSELEAARNEARTRLEAIESKVLPVPATSPTFPRALAHGECESKRCRVGDSRHCSLGTCAANSSASDSRASSFAERVAAKTERRKARFFLLKMVSISAVSSESDGLIQARTHASLLQKGLGFSPPSPDGEKKGFSV